jgi:hypothetical protein
MNFYTDLYAQWESCRQEKAFIKESKTVASFGIDHKGLLSQLLLAQTKLTTFSFFFPDPILERFKRNSTLDNNEPLTETLVELRSCKLFFFSLLSKIT